LPRLFLVSRGAVPLWGITLASIQGISAIRSKQMSRKRKIKGKRKILVRLG
jgi:hypothetical protein